MFWISYCITFVLSSEIGVAILFCALLLEPLFRCYSRTTLELDLLVGDETTQARMLGAKEWSERHRVIRFVELARDRQKQRAARAQSLPPLLPHPVRQPQPRA